MYYKNYWINYVNFGEVFACAICNKDMTNFVNTEFDKDYMHVIKTFPINRYKWEHAENYLDENGLFMGIFPLDIVNQSIDKWNYEQQVFREKIDNETNNRFKVPISEAKFRRYKERGKNLADILFLIETSNDTTMTLYNYKFPIEEYYKDILIKYWGDYKV